MDLETDMKPKFLNHEDLRAWLLTDLEQGTVHETFICKVAKYGEVHCGI